MPDLTPPPEIQRLLTTVKSLLRSQGITYRHLAQRLGLAEISVKRQLNSGRLPLERLVEIAGVLGLSLGELVEQAGSDSPTLSQLQPQQERELIRDPQLLLVAVAALNGWAFTDLLGTYRLEEAELTRALLRLERLGLIDLLPANRIRLRVTRDFRWLPGGPIEQFFLAEGLPDFLAAGFQGPDELRCFFHGMLSPAALTEIHRDIALLRQKFDLLHQECRHLPLGKRQGMALFLGLRSWEPALFARLRRDAPETSS